MGNYISRIFTSIIGLFFGAAGLFFLATTLLPMTRDWVQMKDWQPEEAELLWVKGAKNETLASYRYQILGEEFKGQRVYLAGFKDNIGSYHKRLLHRLQQKRGGKRLVVYVNPAEPDQAIIDRQMRWGLFTLMSLFCLFFVGIGSGLLIAGIFASSPRKIKLPSTSELKAEWEEKKKNPTFRENFIDYRRYRLHELNAAEPDDTGDTNESGETVTKPWLARKEWQSASIRSEARGSMITMWVFSALWWLVSGPTTWFIIPEIRSGNLPALIGFVFPLAGIFLVIKAIRQSFEWRRYGVIELLLDPYPGGIGGNVGGKLRFKTNARSSGRFNVELACIFSYLSGGSDKSRNERIRWAEMGPAHVDDSAGELELSFRFDIPDDLPESDIEESEDYYIWRLTVSSEDEPLNRSYHLPVFKTGERSRFIDHDISAICREQHQAETERSRQAVAFGNFDKTRLAKVVTITKLHPGLRLSFPMFRNWPLTIIALIFAGFFGGISTAILLNFGSTSGWGILGTIISLPFLLVGIFCSVATIYVPLNNLRITIRRNQLIILRRLLFVPILFKQLASQQVKEFAVERSGSTGQGIKKVEHYKIRAVCFSGSRYTIAEDIDGQELAEQLRDYLLRQFRG